MPKKNTDQKDVAENYPIENKSDHDLFQDAVSGTRPLKSSDKIPHYKPEKTIRVERNTTEQIQRDYNLSDPYETRTGNDADEYLSYRGNGIQQQFFKRLRDGQIALESRLDLHGYTTEHARETLCQFIHDCVEHGLRSVLIVHGKGSRGDKPVIKPLLNYWLPQISDVLAFCSAKPRDGGTGAVYVLLKNKRKSNELE